MRVADPELRLLTATLYNDAMAAIQDESGGRLFPMAVLPWWDVDASVREAERAHDLGLRGINTTSAPTSTTSPTSATGTGTRCGRRAPTSACP